MSVSLTCELVEFLTASDISFNASIISFTWNTNLFNSFPISSSDVRLNDDVDPPSAESLYAERRELIAWKNEMELEVHTFVKYLYIGLSNKRTLRWLHGAKNKPRINILSQFSALVYSNPTVTENDEFFESSEPNHRLEVSTDSC